ncbi:cupin domain-containing protein [Streptomyces sp. PKU-EA00015]|uniref:cupin domain-containing protein n=1 Tax=Streptomyces sp. PKU-EA00015 TaxID=2748326 RepID=UPI0015A458E2|nr:cupin domain-containing protein [Streptomyces sp. PKU-EA00015]NWF29323.1 cupin domain-containing protein [Streptomyces sp. PKU-EA00015]
MTPPLTAGVLATMQDLLAVPEGRGGAVWRLDPAARQLDANVIRVLPGDSVARHVEPDLDVLLCVLAGSGELTVGDEAQRLGPGCVAWLPHGTERALAAGPDGLVYVTAHRRRPGLSIRPAEAGTPRRAAEGGESACLLHRICPGCDRPAEDIGARYCSRCGTELPSAEGV